MFHINVKDRMPIYEQLEANIVQYISLGVLKTGDPLPSVRQLAQEIGVNPNTVQKAYSSLERKGVLFIVLGKGAYISDSEKVNSEMRAKAVDKLLLASTEAEHLGVGISEQLAAIENNLKRGEQQ